MSIYKSVINISNFYDSNNKKLIFL